VPRARTAFCPTWTAWTILCLTLWTVLDPCRALAGHPGDRLDEMRRRGFLLAGVKDAVPPFGFRNPKGALEGFEPDLIRAVAKRLGVQARLEPVTSGTRMAALIQGRLDLVAATMTHTFSRDEAIDFSITYFMDGVRLLVPAESGIEKASDLAGRTVGAMDGDSAGLAVAEAQPRCRVASMEGFPQAFLALKQGRVDALAADASILLFLKNADSEPGRWRIAGPAMTLTPVAMGLPENESDLRDAVNRALADIWRSGQYRRIFTHWFGPKTPYHLPLDQNMEIWPQ